MSYTEKLKVAKLIKLLFCLAIFSTLFAKEFTLKTVYRHL